MKYHYEMDSRGVTVSFDAKPCDRIRAILKGSGFRWSSRGGFWWRRRVSGAADVLTAIDKVISPPSDQRWPCWRCGSPEGRFRNRGAAAPVYCEWCAAETEEGER
jgi:hypothetical protein